MVQEKSVNKFPCAENVPKQTQKEKNRLHSTLCIKDWIQHLCRRCALGKMRSALMRLLALFQPPAKLAIFSTPLMTRNALLVRTQHTNRRSTRPLTLRASSVQMGRTPGTRLRTRLSSVKVGIKPGSLHYGCQTQIHRGRQAAQAQTIHCLNRSKHEGRNGEYIADFFQAQNVSCLFAL